MGKHVHAQAIVEKTLAAIDGGQAAVAAALKVPPALVYQWTKGLRPIAAKHAIPLETLTCGAVTRFDVAPEVFGEKSCDS